MPNSVRWIPDGKHGRWITDDPRFKGCVLHKKWLGSMLGPYVVQGPDEDGTPGEGQMLMNGFGASIAAVTRNALEGEAQLAALRTG